MKNSEELIADIKKILKNSDKFNHEGTSMAELGFMIEEYPTAFKCGELSVRIREFTIDKAFVVPYLHGFCEEGCWVKLEDLPFKMLRRLHRIVKEHLK